MESNVQFGNSTMTNTSVIKRSPSTPSPQIMQITEADMRKFVPTGITVLLPLPFFKISTTALFGVNVDGFIPPYNLHSPRAGTPTPIFMNLFPVQPTQEGKRLGIKIHQEMAQLPAIANYLSHRVISGNVGIGIRVSSNTAMTGNFYVSQASGVMRDYYINSEGTTNAEKYDGLRFLNASHSGIDYAQDSCSILDVSLNRNLSITPLRRDITQKTDLAQKFLFVCKQNLKSNAAQVEKYNVGASQFVEDWLLFTPVSDFAGIAANTLSFTIFFDFSRVNFYTPMLLFIPFPPFSNETTRREVFLFTKTFYDKFPDLAISDYKFAEPAVRLVVAKRPVNNEKPARRNNEV